MRDAPSGTALQLQTALRGRGYDRPIDVASSRAGAVPGTHTVGFDAAGETLTLTHTARDRSGFARGALQAAQWVHRKSGWFTMKDVLGL
jgi:4-hydroxy-tetrahydrodipicolinate reductase